ncbi:MAG: replicative DNA helicase [Chloroflexota bacterium]
MVVEAGQLRGGDRLPPHDVEAEEAVLASVLVDPEAVLEVLGSQLKPDDFFREQNRWVYESFLTMFDRGETITQISVAHDLARRGKLEDIGGPAYLSRITAALPTSVGAKYYATIVQADAIYRRLISVAGHIVRRAHESGASTDEVAGVLSEAEALIASVRLDSKVKDFAAVSELLNAYLESIETSAGALAADSRSIRTGFADLDQLLGGLKRGDLVIMAARPSLGKTSLVLNFARNAALAQNATVGFFSVEMAAMQLIQRMVASESGVDSARHTYGMHSDREQQKLVRAMGELGDLPIYFDDSATLTISEMRGKAQRLQQERGLDLIIVDYLQLMSSGMRNENRVQEVSNISRGLKHLARDLDVPIIACSQLSRASEMRAGNIPMLSDLRESGSIEQDADVVMFIYREDRYVSREQWEKDHSGDQHRREYPAGITQLIVAKHRNGPTGTIHLRFRNTLARFEDLLVRDDEWLEGDE